MIKILITKNGFHPVRWDVDTGQYTGVEGGSSLSQLRNVCSIDPGVTLGDIFETVERHVSLKNFLTTFLWCDVDAFHAEARAPVPQPLNLPLLECIEISKYLDFDDDHARETLEVAGIGEPDTEGRRSYGIEITPVNELAPLPVRMNPVVAVRRAGVTIAQAPASFTLLDVLGEIYLEISFHGSPVQRDAFAADLLEAAEEP